MIYASIDMWYIFYIIEDIWDLLSMHINITINYMLYFITDSDNFSQQQNIITKTQK